MFLLPQLNNLTLKSIVEAVSQAIVITGHEFIRFSLILKLKAFVPYSSLHRPETRERALRRLWSILI